MTQPPPSHFSDPSEGVVDPTVDVPESAALLLDRPTSFGRYTNIKKLGRGGMATVYLAHDSQLDRQVALKIPLATAHEDAEFLRRFAREAKVAAAFHHPNICPIHDVGTHDGVPVLTMAYIEGQSLAEQLKERGEPIDVAEAVRLVRTLALTIQNAHVVGIIHRDLKPGNIMMSKDGQPIVMDFGLARRNDSQESLRTRAGQMMGTPAYMPLEQFRGDVDLIGPACDIYSLGVILYQLLTGRLPYEGSPAAVFEKLATSMPPNRPSLLRVGIDPALASACLKAMARDIGDRYPSMSEFARALDDCPQGSSRHDRTRRIRRWVGAGLLGIAGLLGVILYIATDNGTIKITGTDLMMKVLVDGQEVRIENVGEPITIRTGLHKLLVTRDGLEVKADKFLIRRGEVKVVEVSYTPSCDSWLTRVRELARMKPQKRQLIEARQVTGLLANCQFSEQASGLVHNRIARGQRGRGPRQKLPSTAIHCHL